MENIWDFGSPNIRFMKMFPSRKANHFGESQMLWPSHLSKLFTPLTTTMDTDKKWENQFRLICSTNEIATPHNFCPPEKMRKKEKLEIYKSILPLLFKESKGKKSLVNISRLFITLALLKIGLNEFIEWEYFRYKFIPIELEAQTYQVRSPLPCICQLCTIYIIKLTW